MGCKTLNRQHVGALGGRAPQTGGKPFGAQGKPALQVQLRGGGMMFVVVWRGQESDAEIAFIADHAAKWAYEKDSVKDVLQESSSSGFVVLGAGAAWTDVRLIEDRHGPLLPFLAGVQYFTPGAAGKNTKTSAMLVRALQEHQ